MEKQEFVHLAERIADGTANDEEIALYRQYCASFAQKEPGGNTEPGKRKTIGKELKMRIDHALFGTSQSVFYRLHPFIRVAASVALAMGIGFAAWKGYTWLEDDRQMVQTMVADDIAPGTDQAVLILSDGTTVTLEEAGKRVIRQGGTAIRQQEGQLQYTVEEASAPVSYNTLATPRGGQYRLTLPDGSQVWLNAASSITYPTRFTGKERQVEVKGQGYFEVAENPDQPFVVKVNDVVIEVLGTHFDIMAYPEEKEIHTTLVEGSVKITRGAAEKIIAPGEQAFWNQETTAALSVRAIDIQQVTAWKTGFFEFNNANLATIMRQIGRWYNVDVRYQGGADDRTFGGRINRNLPLSHILDLLEANGARFQVEGREIIVL